MTKTSVALGFKTFTFDDVFPSQRNDHFKRRIQKIACDPNVPTSLAVDDLLEFAAMKSLCLPRDTPMYYAWLCQGAACTNTRHSALDSHTWNTSN